MSTLQLMRLARAQGNPPVAPPTPPFDLLTFSQLALYYDLLDPANNEITSGVVTKLKDLSPNGRDTSELFPTGSGLTYTDSGGISGAGFMTLGDVANTGLFNDDTGISGAITAYMVIRWKDFVRTDVPGQGVVKTAIAFNGARTVGLVCDDSGIEAVGYGPLFMNSDTHWSDEYTTIKTTDWQIICMDCLVRPSMNIKVNNQGAPFAYLNGVGPIEAIQVQFGYYSLAAHLDIAALVIIDGGSLSIEDENKVYQWLDNKYPCTKRQFLEVYGDSISTGNTGDFSVWPWLVIADESFDLVSRSHGGTTVFGHDGIAGVAGQNLEDVYQQAFERPYAGQWTVFAFGTNDVNDSVMSEDWKTGYQAIIQQFIVFGYPTDKIIVVKAPTTSIRQADMAACFGYIDDIGTALGVHVYDCNADFIANGGDSLFGDSLHPNSAGNTIYKNGIEAIINA